MTIKLDDPRYAHELLLMGIEQGVNGCYPRENAEEHHALCHNTLKKVLGFIVKAFGFIAKVFGFMKKDDGFIEKDKTP